MTTGKRGRPPRNGPDDADDLERLVSSAGADDVVQIYRRDPVTAKLVYLEQLETTQLRGEGIREFVSRRYGGGDYKARLRNRTTGAYGMTRAFSIAGAPKAFTRDAPTDGTTAAPAAGAAGESSTARIAERIALAIAIPFATAAGGFLAKKLLEPRQADPMLQELIRALNRSRDNGAAIDHLELLKLLQDAEARGQHLGERIGQLAAVADREPAAGDTEDSWGAALVNAIQPLEAIANRYFDLEDKKLNRRSVPPLALVPNAPAGAASSSAAAAVDPADPLVHVLGQIPLMARRFLAGAAESGDDPDAYVPLVLTKLPDAAYQQFAALIDREDFVDVMVAVVPAWGKRREWFARLYAGLRSAIHEAESAAATATPAAEDASGAADAPAADTELTA